MTFDPHRPCRTRDGRKARVLCTDARGDRTLVALCDSGRGEETLRLYADGRGSLYSQASYDLINIHEDREGWLNVYAHRISSVWDSREEVARVADPDRIALLHLTCKDGKWSVEEVQ